jgi:hypothetical protein
MDKEDVFEILKLRHDFCCWKFGDKKLAEYLKTVSKLVPKYLDRN